VGEAPNGELAQVAPAGLAREAPWWYPGKPGEGPGRGDTVCGVRCGFRLKARRQGESAGEELYDTLHDAGQAHDRRAVRMGEQPIFTAPAKEERLGMDWRNAGCMG